MPNKPYKERVEAAKNSGRKKHKNEVPMPAKLKRKIPRYPDGTLMMYLTKHGTLQIREHEGKLGPLPPDFVVPEGYERTPDKAAYSQPKCGVKKDGKNWTGSDVCLQTAGWGTEHLGYGPCKYHGGCLPSVTKRYMKIKEKREMAVFGDKIEIDPHTAVLETVHRTAGHVAWLFEKIQALSETEGDMTLHQYTAMGIKASVWVEMYERERMMLLKASKAAVDMGISERQIQLAEEQGRMIAMVLQQFIDSQEIGLSPAQRQIAPKVIRKLLSEMPTVAKPGEIVGSLPDRSSLPPAVLEAAAKDEESSDDEWEEF